MCFQRRVRRPAFHDQRERDNGRERDGLQILVRVVAEVLDQILVDRNLCGLADQNRVTVRRCSCDALRADRTACSRSILHDDRMAERARELLRNYSRDDVTGTAWRVRDDELHRPARVTLGRTVDRRCSERQSRDDIDGSLGRDLHRVRPSAYSIFTPARFTTARQLWSSAPIIARTRRRDHRETLVHTVKEYSSARATAELENRNAIHGLNKFLTLRVYTSLRVPLNWRIATRCTLWVAHHDSLVAPREC